MKTFYVKYKDGSREEIEANTEQAAKDIAYERTGEEPLNVFEKMLSTGEKYSKAKQLREEGDIIAKGGGTSESTKPLSYEEQRAAYYEERNPVTRAVSSLSEYLAPKSFKSAITGEPNIDWIEKAGEESGPAAITTGSMLVPSALASKVPGVVSSNIAKYPKIAASVGGALGGAAQSGLYQGADIALNDKDFSVGEVGTAAGLGAVIPVLGSIANKAFQKAFNAAPEYFDKLGIASANNIKAAIQTKIDDVITKWKGDITPDQLKTATDKAINELKEIPPPMRDKLKRSLNTRFYAESLDDAASQTNLFPQKQLASDVLKTPEDVIGRLRAAKASGLYDDPLKYEMGSPAQAGAVYRQELERLASGSGADDYAKLIALKKGVKEPLLLGSPGNIPLLDYLSPTFMRSIDLAKVSNPYIADPLSRNVTVPLANYLLNMNEQ